MRNDAILELLSVMDYPITEDMFLALLGSRTDWDEVVHKYLEKVDEMGYIFKTEPEYTPTQSPEECHKEVYYKYIKYLQTYTKITYNNIYEIRDFILKAAKHSLQCGIFNELTEVICKHYKGYLFWNVKKDAIDQYLNQVKDHLSETLRNWIDYYMVFQDIIPHPKSSETGQIKDKLTEIYEQTSLVELKGEILNTLGIIALRAGQAELALKYYQDCWHISQEADHQELAGKSLLNLSVVMKKDDNNAKALTYIKEALGILDDLSDKYYYYLAQYNYLTLLFETDDTLDQISDRSSEFIEDINEDYPDLVRNFAQLKCRVAIQGKKYQEYFALKIIGIICANSLYMQDYFNEFFELLNQIAMMVRESVSIHNGLNEVIEMYKYLQMDDEVQFFLGVQRLLDGEETDLSSYKESIANSSLQELFDDFIQELQSNLTN